MCLKGDSVVKAGGSKTRMDGERCVHASSPEATPGDVACLEVESVVDAGGPKTCFCVLSLCGEHMIASSHASSPEATALGVFWPFVTYLPAVLRDRATLMLAPPGG